LSSMNFRQPNYHGRVTISIAFSKLVIIPN
jgi:hypothetical protein